MYRDDLTWEDDITIAAAKNDLSRSIKDSWVKFDECDVAFLAAHPGEQHPWLPLTVRNALSDAKDLALADLAALSVQPIFLPWAAAKLAAT